MRILITGGTGYLGSHTAAVLSQAGHKVILFDNLCNSRITILHAIQNITGIDPLFVQGDLRDTPLLTKVLQTHKIDAVIHFAGLKAVGESVARPIEYYDNNVVGTLSLLQAMQHNHVSTLIFSSSATVYGNPLYLPIDENHPTNPASPYGRCKLYIENILQDIGAADRSWRIACLRYFNPVGAHASGLLGENPKNIPNNLMPYMLQVAAGELSELQIFGNDYPTKDGTGVRDYVHVLDIAEGHQAALSFLQTNNGTHLFNLGTGQGYSVLELLHTLTNVSGQSIPYVITKRRSGDVATCYADTKKAKQFLNWQSKRELPEMCISAWQFQKKRMDQKNIF